MPTLSDEIKVFIVKGLACFDTPSDVAEAVKVNFGIEVTRQQVYAYDPACAEPPAPRWRELHAATRQAYLQDTAGIAITHRNHRLRTLDRMARHAVKHFNFGRAAALMEQAAKECGGVYDRRQPATAASNPTSNPGPVAAEDPVASPGGGHSVRPDDGLANAAAPRLNQSPQH